MGNYYLVSNKDKNKKNSSNLEGKASNKRPSTKSDRRRKKKSTGGDDNVSDYSD